VASRASAQQSGRDRRKGIAAAVGEMRLVATQTRARARAGEQLRRRFPLRRALAVVLLVFVAILYYRPLAAFVEARDALERRSAEVVVLREQKRRLERQLDATRTPEALVRHARRLAYVKPGEQLFIVKGIERWRRERARAGATLEPDERR
jgi:cell division protein FtsB